MEEQAGWLVVIRSQEGEGKEASLLTAHLEKLGFAACAIPPEKKAALEKYLQELIEGVQKWR